MKTQRFILLMIMLLTVHLVLGCELFDRKKGELPAKRRVKVIVFPIRHLEYSDIKCIQDYENVELSGSVRNLSPYALPNVGVQIKMTFAGDVPYSAYILPTTPPNLLPGEAGTFSLTAVVEDPVARVELHGIWEK